MTTIRSFDKFSFPGRYVKGSPTVERVARELFEYIDVASVLITYYSNDTWYRVQTGLVFQITSLENVVYRRVVQEEAFCEIQDVLNHASYRFVSLRMDAPMIRYIAGVPIPDQKGIASGAILLIDNKRNKLTSDQSDHLARIGQEIITNFTQANALQAPK